MLTGMLSVNNLPLGMSVGVGNISFVDISGIKKKENKTKTKQNKNKNKKTKQTSKQTKINQQCNNNIFSHAKSTLLCMNVVNMNVNIGSIQQFCRSK